MLDSVKELILKVSVCVCQALLYLGQSVSLLRRSLHCWARLVYRKCSKKTVEKVVGPLVSLPVLRVVTMTVFVNEMLLMIAGDVERNPGPGKEYGAYYFIHYIVTASFSCAVTLSSGDLKTLGPLQSPSGPRSGAEQEPGRAGDSPESHTLQSEPDCSSREESSIF